MNLYNKLPWFGLNMVDYVNMKKDRINPDDEVTHYINKVTETLIAEDRLLFLICLSCMFLECERK